MLTIRRPSEELLQDDALGWQTLTTQHVQIRHAAGNHVTMLSSAHAAGLAELLRPCLDAVFELKGEAHA